MKPSSLFFAAVYAFPTSAGFTISAFAVRDLIDQPFSWPTAGVAAAGAAVAAGCGFLLFRTVKDTLVYLFGSRRSVEEMADPSYIPDLDRHERALREVLHGEAERYPADLHDVFEEDR